MQIIQSKLLNKFSNLTHGFTTKEGGVSVPPYESLNLAFHVGDSEKNVLQNHVTVAKVLGYVKRTLVHMKQIHSSKVHKVGSLDNFSNPRECDALITNKTETPLMVMVADCAPILFFDNVKKVIAVAHAGRAGTFSNIIKNVVDSFTNDFHSNTKDIRVVIGANIKACCYQVGEEIFLEVKNLQLEEYVQKKENSYFLDISGILKKQLLESNIIEANIEFMKACNSCEVDTYFSYRVEEETGRFCGIISMNNEYI